MSIDQRRSNFGSRLSRERQLDEWLHPSNDFDELLVDFIRLDGRIDNANRAEVELVGPLLAHLPDVGIDQIYTANSAEKIRSFLSSKLPVEYSVALQLELIAESGRIVPVLARARFVQQLGQTYLRLVKMRMGEVAEANEALKSSLDLHTRIVANAKEAHWAIDFLEEVDTYQPKESIIRQVFENRSVWSMFNPAMSKMYGVPQGTSISANSVRLYWPRSKENEEFVSAIIDAQFSIDNALSVDRRHDGATLYIRNDVRADIKDGRLTRLWGNVRDVSPEKAAQSQATEVTEAFGRAFDALPDAAALFSDSGEVIRRNDAFLKTAGQTDAIERAIAKRVTSAKVSPSWIRLRLAKTPANPAATISIYLTSISGPFGDDWFLAIIRKPAKSHHALTRLASGSRP